MKLIVGLGNPGSQYDRTRHNVGFRVIDALIDYDQNKLGKGKGPFQVSQAPFQKLDLLVAKPTLFMNESGLAVQAMLDQFQVSPGRCLVVIDDVNLPLGRIRFRLKGSAGGHHGLESIISVLGTENFPRLRVGIGNGNLSGTDLTEYVLGDFTKEELKLFAPQIGRARDACLEWAASGAAKVIEQYNS